MGEGGQTVCEQGLGFDEVPRSGVENALIWGFGEATAELWNSTSRRRIGRGPTGLVRAERRSGRRRRAEGPAAGDVMEATSWWRLGFCLELGNWGKEDEISFEFFKI